MPINFSHTFDSIGPIQDMSEMCFSHVLCDSIDCWICKYALCAFFELSSMAYFNFGVFYSHFPMRAHTDTDTDTNMLTFTFDWVYATTMYEFATFVFIWCWKLFIQQRIKGKSYESHATHCRNIPLFNAAHQRQPKITSTPFGFWRCVAHSWFVWKRKSQNVQLKNCVMQMSVPCTIIILRVWCQMW